MRSVLRPATSRHWVLQSFAAPPSRSFRRWQSTPATRTAPLSSEHTPPPGNFIDQNTNDEDNRPLLPPPPKAAGGRVPDAWVAKPIVTDSEGGDLPTRPIREWASLLDVLPSDLRRGLEDLMHQQGISRLTPLQAVGMPELFDGRSVGLFGPHGCGKTLAALVATLARINGALEMRRAALNTAAAQEAEALRHLADTSAGSVKAKDNPRICRYCGLDLAAMRVCPETGAVHPPPPPAEEDADGDTTVGEEGSPRRRRRRVAKRPLVAGEMGQFLARTRCTPRLLVLAPTSVAAEQIRQTLEILCRYTELTVGCSLRASALDPHLNQRVVNSVHECDVLVASPTRAWHDLTERRLQLHNLEAVIVDAADWTLSREVFNIPCTLLQRIRSLRRVAWHNHLQQQQRRGGPAGDSSGDDVAIRPVQTILTGTVLSGELKRLVTTAVLPSRSCRVVSADFGRAETGSVPNGTVEHHVHLVSRVERLETVVGLYRSGQLHPGQRVLLFVNGRAKAALIATELQHAMQDLREEAQEGRIASVMADHDMAIASVDGATDIAEQKRIVEQLHRGVLNLVVCTEVFSLGLDLEQISAVVLFDLPAKSFSPFFHMRVGQCGWMAEGRKGVVHTMFTPTDVRHAKRLVRELRMRNQRVPHRLQQYAKMSPMEVVQYAAARGKALRHSGEDNAPIVGAGSTYPTKEEWFAPTKARPSS